MVNRLHIHRVFQPFDGTPKRVPHVRINGLFWVLYSLLTCHYNGSLFHLSFYNYDSEYGSTKRCTACIYQFFREGQLFDRNVPSFWKHATVAGRCQRAAPTKAPPLNASCRKSVPSDWARSCLLCIPSWHCDKTCIFLVLAHFFYHTKVKFGDFNSLILITYIVFLFSDLFYSFMFGFVQKLDQGTIVTQHRESRYT